MNEEWMNEKMNERINERMNEWKNKWMINQPWQMGGHILPNRSVSV